MFNPIYKENIRTMAKQLHDFGKMDEVGRRHSNLPRGVCSSVQIQNRISLYIYP